MYDRTKSDARQNAEGQSICCATCLWWAWPFDGHGQCRVNPPDMSAQANPYRWPQTTYGEWCRCWTWNHYLKEIKDGEETSPETDVEAEA